ncbi:MAG TPA: hypothetical protein VF173_37340 [Thermoanaerobaculia bacterium]|nr:hypothetical protein [Thermoanaerobaculia bacterium]
MFKTIIHCALVTALGVTGIAQAGERPNGAANLPVIGTESSFRGGETLALHGLLAAQSIATDLAFVNLAQTGNRCTLALTTADGTALGPVVTLTLAPRENRPFANVFEKMTDAYSLFEAKAIVSCEQEFSAYAQMADSTTGQVDVITPEAESDTLEAPKAVDCPAGATCFDAPGVVHVPVPPPGLPWGRVTFPAPKGTAKRLRLSLNVTVAGWYAPEPDGKNLIYWFVIDKNIDMPGLLYFLGPKKNQAFARHGIGLKHPQKLKIKKPFAAEIGHTYHVDNDYDMTGHNYTITITDVATGQVKVVLHSRPNVSFYNVKQGAKFLVDMGFFPGLVPTEIPSYGWTYADVHVEAYMR